jgi:hypothetical protein
MEFYETPVVVANSWKTELMDSIIATANLEGWTTIRNAYADGTYTRWVLESPDTKFNAIFFTVTTALNLANDNTTPGRGNLYVTLAETYNTSTEEFNGVSPVRNNNFVADNTTETYNNVFTIATLISAGNTGPGFLLCSGGDNASIDQRNRPNYYAISVDTNTILLAIKSTNSGVGSTTINNNCVYLGNINSEVVSASTNDPNNACIFSYRVGSPAATLTGGTLDAGGSVRSPMNGGKVAHSWTHTLAPAFALSSHLSIYTGLASTTWDQWQGSVGPTATEVIIYRNGGTTQPTFGLYRGKAKNIVFAAALLGDYSDLLTIGTDTYYCSNVSTAAGLEFWIRSA